MEECTESQYWAIQPSTEESVPSKEQSVARHLRHSRLSDFGVIACIQHLGPRQLRSVPGIADGRLRQTARTAVRIDR